MQEATKGSFKLPDSVQEVKLPPNESKGSSKVPASEKGTFKLPDSMQEAKLPPNESKGSFKVPASGNDAKLATKGSFKLPDSMQEAKLPPNELKGSFKVPASENDFKLLSKESKVSLKVPSKSTFMVPPSETKSVFKVPSSSADASTKGVVRLPPVNSGKSDVESRRITNTNFAENREKRFDTVSRPYSYTTTKEEPVNRSDRSISTEKPSIFLAKDALKQKDYSQARAHFFNAARNDSNIEACLYLAYAHLYGGITLDRNFKEAQFWVNAAAQMGSVAAQAFLGILSHLSHEPNQGNFKMVMKSTDGLAKGICHYFGFGTEVDYNLSVTELQQEAEKGSELAQEFLGRCFLRLRNDEKAETWFRKSANSGLARAQYDLAKILQEKNSEEAVMWFTEAACQNNVDAQLNLGLCLEHGTGVKMDSSSAFEWYLKCVQQNDMRGQYHLALCFEKGVGATKSTSKSLDWLEKSAKNGFGKAQMKLGKHYMFPEDETEPNFTDKQRAAHWYRQAAESGDATACKPLAIVLCDIALHYLHGKGVAKNGSLFFECLLEAANLGDDFGQCGVGFCYERGKGVVEDKSQAVSWYTKAADQGNEFACCCLGKILEQRGAYNSAADLYAKAAEKGNADGYCLLGTCYDEGKGVPQHRGIAYFLFLKASDKGHATGSFNAALSLMQGKGVACNLGLGAALLKEAGQKGCPEAQNLLGQCYRYGKCGFPQDPKISMSWFQKAVQARHAPAMGNLAVLLATMQPGGKKDLETAKILFQDAAAIGHDISRENLGKMKMF